MRNPRDFFEPLAIDAPEPPREIPFKPSLIRFFDASNEKMRAKVPDMAKQADILLGNLEDAVPVDKKIPAREGLIEVGKEVDFGDAQLWSRVNALESPWVLDDLTQLVTEIGEVLEVIMVPKVEGPGISTTSTASSRSSRPRRKLERPLLIHAILETSLGVVNLEEIATASPRMQGMSFGPADLAAFRRMKTTRVGGGHPCLPGNRGSRSRQPGRPPGDGSAEPPAPSIARMVDACTSAGILLLRALRRHQGHPRLRDPVPRRLLARMRRRVVASPGADRHRKRRSSVRRPRRSSSPRRSSKAIPDGAGVHMIDGKMQDDATWKQCKVMVSLAEMLAKKDPELAKAYEMKS